MFDYRKISINVVIVFATLMSPAFAQTIKIYGPLKILSVSDFEALTEEFTSPIPSVTPEEMCREIVSTWYNEEEFSNEYDCQYVKAIRQIDGFNDTFIWLDIKEGRSKALFFVDRWKIIEYFLMNDLYNHPDTVKIVESVGEFKIPSGKCIAENYRRSLSFIHNNYEDVYDEFSLNLQRDAAVCSGGVSLEGGPQELPLGSVTFWLETKT